MEGDYHYNGREAAPAMPTTPAGTIAIGGDLVVGRIGYGAMQLTGKLMK